MCLYLTPFLLHRAWSKQGVETVILSDTEVECIVNHLSTFAVLVDHQDVHREVDIGHL